MSANDADLVQDSYSDELRYSHQQVLDLVKEANVASDLEGNVRLERALASVGLKPTAHCRKVLFQLRNSRACPLHWDLLRLLVSKPQLSDNLGDEVLTEFHLDLSVFSRVFRLLTPSFFRDKFLENSDEESVWFAARELERSISCETQQGIPLESLRQLLDRTLA